MGDPQRRLILFTRFPVVGKVKTRLIPALGAEGATALHRRLVLRTLRIARAFCHSQKVALEIRFAGDNAQGMQHWLGDGWIYRSQSNGDLGQRMADAFAESFVEGSPATVIIGSDCPSLTPEVLQTAFEALQTNSVVFGPATDGGYYLVGLTRPIPEMFRGIDWGTETVLAQSLEILARGNTKSTCLQPLDDLDRPEDVAAWQRLVSSDDNDLTRISVIVPALNEEASITSTLEKTRNGSPHEIIVVDGGSTDQTCSLATKLGAAVIHSKPGRARQMNAGAACATGTVLLFLHADTTLPDNWATIVPRTLKKEGIVAGSFTFRIRENFLGRGVVEWTTNLRSRWLQSPYGDQGLYLRRSLFEELGGFADLPIMEDYELNWRLRKIGKMVTAEAVAITSGRRWKRLGVIRTTIINQIIIFGFHLGVSAEKLARIYRRSS